MSVALNDNEICLTTPLSGRGCGLLAPCSNVYGVCIDMAGVRSALVQPYKFNPESDPDREAPKEVQTLWRQ